MSEIHQILINAPEFLSSRSFYFDSVDYIYNSRYFNFKIHIVTNSDSKLRCFRIIRNNFINDDYAYDTVFFTVKVIDIWELLSKEQQKYFAFHIDLLMVKNE